VVSEACEDDDVVQIERSPSFQQVPIERGLARRVPDDDDAQRRDLLENEARPPTAPSEGKR
jgi:hypothetical protein